MKRLSLYVSIIMVILAFIMFPAFLHAENLINLVQELYGFLSMPILSAFIVGLLFKNVDARAVIIAVILGVLLYTMFTQVWPKLPGGNYIHMMAVTLLFSVTAALIFNHFIFGKKAVWDAHNVFGKTAV